jgi:hypothetical protein
MRGTLSKFANVLIVVGDLIQLSTKQGFFFILEHSSIAPRAKANSQGLSSFLRKKTAPQVV